VLYITSFGTYREGFQYKELSLRVGWAGYIMQTNGSKFMFSVDVSPDTGDPVFRVTNPAGESFEASNPTKAIKDSGFLQGKTTASGPLTFGLKTDLIKKLNQARCGWCHSEARVEADLKA
jgi:hypothetical protein